MQHQHQQSYQQYQNFRANPSSSFVRRDVKETSKWHDSQESSCRRNVKVHHSTKRPYERDEDVEGERERDRDRERRDREKKYVLRNERERDRCKTRCDRNSRDIERCRDRNYQDCDDRGRKYDKYSMNRNRSDSTLTRSVVSAKHDNRSNYSKNDQIKSSSSRQSSTSRSVSVKRETSIKREPVPRQRSNDNELWPSGEKSLPTDNKEPTERARILEKWRSNFCETSEDITRKLEELAEDNEKECWIRSSPADLFYKRTSVNEIEGTARLEALCTLFKTELVERGSHARQLKPVVEEKPKKRKHRVCRHKSKKTGISSNI